MRPAIRFRQLLSELPYLLIAVGASAPAWIVKYPPIQDMPYHVATIRVLHSIHDPAFGLDQHFQLQLGNTHYLLYYLAGSLLSYLVGVAYANVALMSAYFAGTVLAARSLLRSMGRDPRISILVIPLLVNVLFIYGLLPFLIGIPLMFWGLSVALRHFREPAWPSGLLLAGISVALFYAHIIPFGLFGLGVAAMFPWLRYRKWGPCIAPVAPVVGLLAWWSTATDAGRTTGGLLTGEQGARVRKLDAAVRDIPNWFADVLRDESDERWLIAFGVLIVVSVAAGLGEREKLHAGTRRYGVVPLSCVLLYFGMPIGHDFIWPLAQRFAILFALTAVPLVPFPRGWRGWAVTAGALGVAGGATYNTAEHFVQFQLEEVGDFDEAKAVIEPRSKVCTLIYDKGSGVTHHQPFIHFGSWYQVEKGGMVMFTFAGYPHWPFDFQPGKDPPPGGPARRRWEWTPKRVRMNEVYPYYDYVLVRGRGFRPPPAKYRPIYDGSRWTVFQRQGPEHAP